MTRKVEHPSGPKAHKMHAVGREAIEKRAERLRAEISGFKEAVEDERKEKRHKLVTAFRKYATIPLIFLVSGGIVYYAGLKHYHKVLDTEKQIKNQIKTVAKITESEIEAGKKKLEEETKKILKGTSEKNNKKGKGKVGSNNTAVASNTSSNTASTTTQNTHQNTSPQNTSQNNNQNTVSNTSQKKQKKLSWFKKMLQKIHIGRETNVEIPLTTSSATTPSKWGEKRKRTSPSNNKVTGPTHRKKPSGPTTVDIGKIAENRRGRKIELEPKKKVRPTPVRFLNQKKKKNITKGRLNLVEELIRKSVKDKVQLLQKHGAYPHGVKLIVRLYTDSMGRISKIKVENPSDSKDDHPEEIERLVNLAVHNNFRNMPLPPNLSEVYPVVIMGGTE